MTKLEAQFRKEIHGIIVSALTTSGNIPGKEAELVRQSLRGALRIIEEAGREG